MSVDQIPPQGAAFIYEDPDGNQLIEPDWYLFFYSLWLTTTAVLSGGVAFPDAVNIAMVDLDAIGADVANAGGTGGTGTVTHTAGPLTANQLVTGNGAADLQTLGTLGTATTVLHGNAAGAPTFGAVSLTADVSGNLPVTNLNSGTGASASTFWRGDAAWNALPVGVNLLEVLGTAAPNTVINAVGLQVTGPTASTDFFLQPHGASSAFYLGPVADNSATGGNKRGTGAVDLQLKKTAATTIASGSFSGVLSGQGNVANNTNSVVCGGTAGTSSGVGSMVLGGGSCAATNTGSIAGGNSATSTGINSLALGGAVTANADYSTAIGINASAKGIVGAFAHSGYASGTGQQRLGLVLIGTTTDAATVLKPTSNGGAPAATNQFLLQNTSALKVRGQVVGRATGTGDAVWFDFSAAVKNVAATVSLSGATSVTAAAGDASLLTCTFAIGVDTVNKCLQFLINGVAATTIKWTVEAWSCENA